MGMVLIVAAGSLAIWSGARTAETETEAEAPAKVE